LIERQSETEVTREKKYLVASEVHRLNEQTEIGLVLVCCQCRHCRQRGRVTIGRRSQSGSAACIKLGKKS